MHGAVLAAIALTVFMHDPAVAKRAATRASCVAACDATTGDCIAAAGASVTKKTQRRCRRKTLRRCVRTGLSACPRSNPCPSTPNIVGTWESTDVTCSRTCLISGGGEAPRFEKRPCDPPEQPPFRIVVNGQGAACNVFSVTEPYVGIGMMDLAATPITFTLTGPLGVPLLLLSYVDGSIEGDTLTGVSMSFGVASLPDFCSKGIVVGPMTRVAGD